MLTPEEISRLAAGKRAEMEAEEAERQALADERARLEVARAQLVHEANELAMRRALAVEPDPAPEPEDEEESSDEAECPDCAEWIKAKAKVCRFCGCRIVHGRVGKSGRKPERRRAPRRHTYVQMHNPALCAFLSFLIPGVGQMVAGETGRGFSFMAACMCLGLLGTMVLGCAGLVAWFAVAVFAIVDAYNVAEAANRRARLGR